MALDPGVVRLRVLPLILAGSLLPFAAFATDGRIEINQTSVQNAGGFPFLITNPGSYVLTSDLVVTPAGATGVLVHAHDVSLDLNGFGIRGSYVCDQSSCLFDSGRGVEAAAVPTGGIAARTRLAGGTVRGFGLECVKLGTDARVEGIAVSSCGDAGISVGSRGLVLGNQVSFTGVHGLRLMSTTGYSQNVIALADLGFGPGAAVTGGSRGVGNVCDGKTCPGGLRRRFYLTAATYTGAQADQASSCAPGFHFASLWEIHDTTNLEYDLALGVQSADSGQGPPAAYGWVRTGMPPEGGGAAGITNCNAWTSTGGNNGTVAGPSLGTGGSFGTGWRDPAELSSPWKAVSTNCDLPRPIWCVQD